MRTVLRFLFVIPLGFVAACCAAAFALLWPFLDVAPETLDDPFAVFELVVGAGAQVVQIGTVAFVPFAVFVLVAEVFGLSSLLAHVGLGAAAGLVLSRVWYGGAASGSVETAMVVAGLAFFLVYWLVAGRGARPRHKVRAGTEPGDGPPISRKS